VSGADDDDKLEIEPLATTQEHRRPATPSAPTGAQARARLPLVALALVALGGAGEALALVVQHLRAATDEDWRAAAAALRAERRRDEPVLFAPHWADPMGRAATAGQIDLELMLLSDVDRYPRVWELSVRGASHPFLAGSAPARSRRFGAVTLALHERKPEEVLYDFTRRVLDDARVERVGDRLTRCGREGRWFACDRAERWNRVGLQLAEVGHRPYRCIYAHPVDGHLMRLTFRAVPMGRALVGYTGIDDFENRKRSQKPVLLEVRAGEEILGTVRHDSAWPWHRFRFDTAALAGKSVEVRFDISAEGAYARTFCFAAETRR
jgi:hypothetical protein